jgi:hypothetical protein
LSSATRHQGQRLRVKTGNRQENEEEDNAHQES